MKCFNCKTEALEKFTNEGYSEYLKKMKKVQKQDIEFGWICKNCGDKLCVMCRKGVVSKFIPAQKEGNIFVVKDMESAEGKTKELYSRLKNFGFKKAMLVDEKINENFNRAARNIPGFRYCTTDAVNVYDLLRYKALVVTESALKALEKRCEAGK